MYTTLDGWKTRRKDKKTEKYWELKELKGPLNGFEKYQKHWNFIEAEYNYRPSNNGLDLGNPSFAFETKLAKYLKIKEKK